MAIRLSANRLDLGSANLTNAEMRGWSETVSALGNVTGATTIDLSLGNVITATTTGATTWTVTNASSTQTSSFTLILTNGGSQTQTWMSGTQWAQGVAPTLNSSGTDVLTFFTTDAGTTWRGAKGGPTPGDQSGQKLFVWGSGAYGLLGLGDTIKRSSPVQLAGTWSQVIFSTNLQTGIALKPEGSLWVWGQGFAGVLGNGSTDDRSSPVQVAGTWSSIHGGYQFSGLKADGSLWPWGWGQSGALGFGDTINRSSPVQLAGTWKMAAHKRGGGSAIRADGTLWTWGHNAGGQLGMGDTLWRSSPVQVTGTWSKVFSSSVAYGGGVAFLKADGSLWRAGFQYYGSFGLGDTANRSSPTQLAGTWRKVAVTGSSLMIRHDGTLWSCGGNLNGLLGLGDTILRSSPVQIGTGVWSDISLGRTASALTADGRLFTWGDNTDGQLGFGDTIKRSSPTQVPGTWSSLSAGSRSMGAFKI